MEANIPSHTAQGAALHRAAHQILDNPPLFDDPLALKIIGPEAERELLAGTTSRMDSARAGLRAFIATRSRFSEDGLREAVADGVDQYVLLGAGLDTFAYRAARHYPGLHVFEVDHPATQAWKRGRLSELEIAAPASLTFAPVNFETETLADGLKRAGFNFDKPAVFAWLGVVPYLTREAVTATLKTIAALPAKSTVIFDYAQQMSASDIERNPGFRAMAERVAASGEPFLSFFIPDKLVRDVAALGFSDVQNFGAAELNALYFKGRADELRLRGGNILRAVV